MLNGGKSSFGRRCKSLSAGANNSGVRNRTIAGSFVSRIIREHGNILCPHPVTLLSVGTTTRTALNP